MTQPPPWPWPWPSIDRREATLTVTLHTDLLNGADVPRYEMPLVDVVRSLEEHFDRLPRLACELWRDVFEGSGDTFSKRSLLMALDLIDASGHGLAEVATLRTARLLSVDDGAKVTHVASSGDRATPRDARRESRWS